MSVRSGRQSDGVWNMTGTNERSQQKNIIFQEHLSKCRQARPSWRNASWAIASLRDLEDQINARGLRAALSACPSICQNGSPGRREAPQSNSFDFRWNLGARNRVSDKSFFEQLCAQIHDTKAARYSAQRFAPRPILGSWGVAYLRPNLCKN